MKKSILILGSSLLLLYGCVIGKDLPSHYRSKGVAVVDPKNDSIILGEILCDPKYPKFSPEVWLSREKVNGKLERIVCVNCAIVEWDTSRKFSKIVPPGYYHLKDYNGPNPIIEFNVTKGSLVCLPIAKQVIITTERERSSIYKETHTTYYDYELEYFEGILNSFKRLYPDVYELYKNQIIRVK